MFSFSGRQRVGAYQLRCLFGFTEVSSRRRSRTSLPGQSKPTSFQYCRCARLADAIDDENVGNELNQNAQKNVLNYAPVAPLASQQRDDIDVDSEDMEWIESCFLSSFHNAKKSQL